MDDSHIPIDINTTKLLEWLVSRRHVSKDWQENIIKIREKINNAIQDMPAHDGIIKLLSGQHINYFHCLKIITILKETEADSKNLFGRYGSQRMKDWQDIVSCYEVNNIYLAEAAQILMRNVAYEVPSLKKRITKLEQMQGESDKKIKDYTRAEHMAQNEFNAICKQLVIDGKDIRKELVNLVNDIPEMNNKFMKNLLSVEKFMNVCIEFYEAFINFHSGNDNSIQALPLLKYLLTNGNTTTYEYTYGEKPVSIELPQLEIVDESESKTDSIDFGDDIDFGDNVQIDFGDISVQNIDLSTPMSEGDIDWGAVPTDEEFEIVDMDVNLEESGIVVEKSGLDGGVAKGNDAYTILDNPKTREQVLNDLMELAAFLKIRLYEMSSNSDLLLMNQLDAPAILQMQSQESVTALSDYVAVVLNELINKRAQQLHNIKHSSKYVDILTNSLKHKLEIVQRMQTSKNLLEDKIKEHKDEIRAIEPVIKKVIEKTKILQKEMQEDLSKKYKGRVVNIIGGVNTM